jgi:FMN phosphatase YigB (HAD superfamily)
MAPRLGRPMWPNIFRSGARQTRCLPIVPVLSSCMAVKVVFFDVGETLISEARLWNGWAAYMGVPVNSFLSVLEDVIARGEHHRRVFERLRPGFDVEAARLDRATRRDVDLFDATDLYPDVMPCLRILRERGYMLGVAGNQPATADRTLRTFGLDVDLIASSDAWGVEKPSPAFFEKLVTASNVPPGEIAYVGDRLDNDVLPSHRAGMISVFLERGPWGRAHAKRPEARLSDVWIKTLAELPDALYNLPGTHRQT